MKDEGKTIALSFAFILPPSSFRLAFPFRAFPFEVKQWLQARAELCGRLQLRGQWRLCTAFPDPSPVG
jgi:hypothetical protein